MSEDAKSWQNGPLGCVVMLVIFGLSGIAIYATVNPQAFNSAYVPSAAGPDPVLSAQAKKAVIDSVTTTTDPRPLELAELAGGIGIVTQFGGAYWFSSGELFACNGLALSHSPGVARVDPALGVGVREIEEAVKRGAP